MVAEAMIRLRVSSLNQLLTETSLSRQALGDVLRLLLRHNVATFLVTPVKTGCGPRGATRTLYFFLEDAAFLRAHHSRLVSAAQSVLGAQPSLLLEEILHHGRISKRALLLSAASFARRFPAPVHLQDPQEAFAALLASRLVVPAPEVERAGRLQLQRTLHAMEAPTLVQKGGVRSRPGTKRTAPPASAALPQSVAHASETGSSSAEAVFAVDVRQLSALLRDEAVARYGAERFFDLPDVQAILSAMLAASRAVARVTGSEEAGSDDDGPTEVSPGLGLNSLGQSRFLTPAEITTRVVLAAAPSGSALPPAPTGMQIESVSRTLAALAHTQRDPIVAADGDTYAVNVSMALGSVCFDVVCAALNASRSEAGTAPYLHRVYRLLALRGVQREEQVAQRAMLPATEARSALGQLMSLGLVRMESVPRVGEADLGPCAAARTHQLWRADEVAAARNMLDRMAHASLNLRHRQQVLAQRNSSDPKLQASASLAPLPPPGAPSQAALRGLEFALLRLSHPMLLLAEHLAT
jgi:hypothetical protein